MHVVQQLCTHKFDILDESILQKAQAIIQYELGYLNSPITVKVYIIKNFSKMKSPKLGWFHWILVSNILE